MGSICRELQRKEKERQTVVLIPAGAYSQAFKFHADIEEDLLSDEEIADPPKGMVAIKLSQKTKMNTRSKWACLPGAPLIHNEESIASIIKEGYMSLFETTKTSVPISIWNVAIWANSLMKEEGETLIGQIIGEDVKARVWSMKPFKPLGQMECMWDSIREIGGLWKKQLLRKFARSLITGSCLAT